MWNENKTLLPNKFISVYWLYSMTNTKVCVNIYFFSSFGTETCQRVVPAGLGSVTPAALTSKGKQRFNKLLAKSLNLMFCLRFDSFIRSLSPLPVWYFVTFDLMACYASTCSPSPSTPCCCRSEKILYLQDLH